ncbi:MAG: glycosyl hydrolase family 95 catalytic domain-containing protein, partial [Bryobacteraceae bacterium]
MDSSHSRRAFIGTGFAAVAAAQTGKGKTPENAGDASDRTRISRADLIYGQPAARSEEGMPLGNGRMGTLVWTTPSQVRFQINRVDVYANNSYSNSFFERNDDYCGGCAYVEIDFSDFGDPPFVGTGFHQRLAVYDGAMALRGRGVQNEMVAWPAQDVMAIEVNPTKAAAVQVKLRMLRHASQYFGKELEAFAREHVAAVQHRSQMALCQLLIRGGRIALTQEFREGAFYNKSAVAIGIVGRTVTPEIADETEIRLTTEAAGKPFTVLIASAASFDTNADVAAAALAQLEAAGARGYRTIANETADWWHDFWSRGRVEMHSEDGAADSVEQNYNYFLYVMAASSRGKFPPKFNGMLWNTGGDLRTWGAQHWFANLSCYYEGLFEANRPELLDPAFDMYSGMYDACRVAARQQWGSEGMYIPETAYFDGLEKLPDDVASEMRELYLMRKSWPERSQRFRTYSETKHPHSSRWNWMASGRFEKGRWVITERGYGPYGNVTHIFGSTAKIAYLYWRRYEFTQDREWLRTRAYPMLRGAAEFYRKHPNTAKEADGKYHLRYANSNESVWGARDTDEDFSSMRGVCAALLRASEILGVDAEMRAIWREFLANLTPLPT